MKLNQLLTEKEVLEVLISELQLTISKASNIISLMKSEGYMLKVHSHYYGSRDDIDEFLNQHCGF